MLTALLTMCSYLFGQNAPFRSKIRHFATLKIFEPIYHSPVQPISNLLTFDPQKAGREVSRQTAVVNNLNMKEILPILSILLILGCNHDTSTDINIDSPLEKPWKEYLIDKSLYIQELDSNDQYFVLRDLTIANEKSLKSYDSELSIRIIYSDSWAPSNIMRLECKIDKFKREYVEINATEVESYWNPNMCMFCDSARGEVLTTLKRRIISNEYFNLKDTILSKIEKYQLFEISTTNDFDGNDGYGLFLELIVENRYKVIYRWTPGASNYQTDREFLDFCRYIYSLQYLGNDKIGWR
jgi:hypothetical protein